jgi:hypothetical protein
MSWPYGDPLVRKAHRQRSVEDQPSELPSRQPYNRIGRTLGFSMSDQKSPRARMDSVMRTFKSAFSRNAACRPSA